MYLGIDFETQGFDEKKDAPTEIGLIVFNDKFEEVNSLNFIIKSQITKKQTEEIVELTGITDEMITNGTNEYDVAIQILPYIQQATALFAYNAPFDIKFLNEILARNCIPHYKGLVVDVMRDIDYPAKFKCKKLSHLAYDHGIIMEHGSAHRAVADVSIMIKLLSKYSLESAIKNASEEKVNLRIKTPPPWEDKGGNEYSKANGYHFDPSTKFWVKQVRASEVNKIIAESKYPVERLK